MSNNQQQPESSEESVETVTVNIADLEKAEFEVMSGSELRIKLESIDFSFSY